MLSKRGSSGERALYPHFLHPGVFSLSHIPSPAFPFYRFVLWDFCAFFLRKEKCIVTEEISMPDLRPMVAPEQVLGLLSQHFPTPILDLAPVEGGQVART